MNARPEYEERHRPSLQRNELQRNDLLAMQALAPLSLTYLPWSASAMRPSGVVAVLNEILVHQRRSVVELGSGVSTFYIGRLLRQRGGHLWTVEHDERWAKLLGRELANEGLGDVVTVVHAPLTPAPSRWPGEESTWYEQRGLTEMTAGRTIDLLVVDGPPAYQATHAHSRYPAGPFFAPLFAEDFAVVLDDIDRRGEQDIMQRWEHELGVTFEHRPTNGRIGIGRPGPAFTV
ncbi:Methyltransferase domain-containing protein [Micromonospora matsumotoense]|uniref:Methyltransferase domain-containing protein n=1 Tax=Micromonospora matsumotoense TaxID=121616 RepID=A0A1C4Z3E8_9ACTN|nr:class I SAM-dependent methyltransferase [Micromonospora matsumotoense]SCF27490.1 Methyltransferase domain-containing protein [Micromonospora matsumotoense]